MKFPELLRPILTDVFVLAKTVKDGYPADPGTSDLDDEQPIHVSMTLREYRIAVRLYYELRKD